MMKISVLCVTLLGLLTPVHAEVVAVFDNPTYVNSSGGAGAASDSIQALLTSLGDTVAPFTGISAADFISAGSGANLILFPDLLNFGALVGALSAPAKAALANYVSSGGGLIAVGSSAHTLLNAIFYPTCAFVSVFCLASSGTSGPSFQDTAVTAGTPFAADPSTLSSPPQPGTGLNP